MTNKIYSVALALLLTGCGGGSNNSNSSSLITVPPSTISTPINQPTPATVCTNPHIADYPSSYNGVHNIPQPTQMLSLSYDRGISFKDYYPGWIYDSGNIKNCSKDEYIKLMYTQSLDRLASSGATMTWLYNYGPLTDATASELVISESNYHTPLAVIEFVVQEAKKRNIDVYYVWQFNPNDVNGKTVASLGENLTPEKLTKLLDAHHAQMISVARFAQKTGMKGVSADWNAFHIPNLDEPKIKELYTSKYVQIINSIRANFSGEVTWGQIGQVYSDPRIIEKVDSIHISLGGPLLTPAENATLTVEKVENAINKQLLMLYQQYKCTDTVCAYTPSSKEIPVFFEVAVQSRDNYWSEGWVEDGFCVKGKVSGNTDTDCVQQYYTTDFSVQAIGIEGTMRAITKQRYFKVGGVNLHSSYWHSDTLTPNYEGFPNISQSIRGKPAEKIVKYWFTGR